MRKIGLFGLLLLFAVYASAQTKPLSQLTVEEIMQAPEKFIGTSPSRVSWSKDSKNIFFYWDPDGNGEVSAYQISKDGGTPEKIDDTSEGWPSNYEFNQDKTKIVYTEGGDIYIKELKSEKVSRLTATNDRETNPSFHKENVISFVVEDNLFTINTETGLITQLTNFIVNYGREDESPSRRGVGNGNSGNRIQDSWLREDQLNTSEIIKERRNRPRRSFRGFGSFGSFGDNDNRDAVELPNIRSLQLSPDGRFVSFSVYHSPENGAQNTIVPNYVTNSGYTTDINARSKVGGEQGYSEIGIYSISGDSVYYLDKMQLPGITDLPDYTKDYPDKEWTKEPRKVSATTTLWSGDGKYAVVQFSADDNKDRWIMRLIPETGDLITIDRQRDEAWIGGPGVSGFGGTFGFLPDNKTIYFQSEKTGYSHLYTHDISTGTTKQLTSGNYEVYQPKLSNDGKKWYFTANMKHPGIKHFYSLPLNGGKPIQITTLDGGNEVTLSPDEKSIAIEYSYIDQPTELYVMDNKPGAKAKKLTESLKEGFKAYDWHQPEIITFKAEDGADVHARLYKPENPNGAGVIFVHGAGYLQNVHYWWSTYFREFMFNNMLMAKGYTVLDIDYRASSGYGRDWRTGIYRHMGGKDLSDQIDGAKFLMNEHGVEAGRIGMYGGSYGGFITLFAMFKHPDVISAGAALRSVTDWAHYNHGYTSNILNTPVEDPIAYKRSSPIYFAEGLEGNLLIAHGMVDTNVHFQDVVRLAQRLIELGKDNWEMALYPVENHGFTEPSSWTDEYKRIFKLFENTIGKK
ncbi:prolyl oligopeptidase family serine peptidase [uncultured Roseivirga sp.]|mgnify:CR=1 FL=1|uniref:S9 family peptidase n=1 Tax=uncultured Roseivirga sp. TaxID=543088 RepID=UPI000D79C58C|nr:prolyl oligopeptidase family serine peptidase [uncultured Roseivirga sp.]PWL28643.1 MAG: S9 family peptidase [Roseivirga sp. XM-24bin3]